MKQKKTSTNWICEHCGSYNPPRRETCWRCGIRIETKPSPDPIALPLIIYIVAVLISTLAVAIVFIRTDNIFMIPITLVIVKVLLIIFVPVLLYNQDAVFRKLERIGEIVFFTCIVNFFVFALLTSLVSPLITKDDIFTIGFNGAANYTGLSYWVYWFIKIYQGFFMLHFWIAFTSPLPRPQLRSRTSLGDNK